VDQQQTFNSITSSSIISSAGAPAFSAGASFDTLDFSLPSYNEATKSDTLDVKSAAKEEKSSSAADEAAERAAKKVCRCCQMVMSLHHLSQLHVCTRDYVEHVFMT